MLHTTGVESTSLTLEHNNDFKQASLPLLHHTGFEHTCLTVKYNNGFERASHLIHYNNGFDQTFLRLLRGRVSAQALPAILVFGVMMTLLCFCCCC